MALFEYKEVPRISVLSTTFVKCTVSSTELGLPVNPTSGVVSFAFLTNNSQPASGDWKTGSWETAGGVYWAKCLIGPDGGVVALPAGSYEVWVRLVKTPETVIDLVGKLTIY